MVFAHILYTYFSELSPNKNTMIHIGISIFILTLIKASGAGLAIIAVAIIGVDVIRKNHFKQGILFLLIPLLCLCIGKFSWDVYLKITGTSEAWDMSNLSAAGLLGLFNGTAPSYFKDVILSFANRFFEFHGQGALQLSYFNWTIILILLAAVGFQFFSPNSEKARTKIYTTGVVLGFCAYLFSLLILYLFTYSEYEAINLNSYDRYVSTYILGAVAFFILMILDVSLKKSSRSTNWITWIILCVLTILLPFQLLLRFCIIPMVDNGITREYRAAMQYSESFADFMDPKTDRIYLVSQHTTGKEYWVIRHNSTPIPISLRIDSSFGPPIDEDDWSKEISVEDWEKILRSDYTYVYLFVVDQYFKENYADLFDNPEEIQNDTLFVIDKSGEHIKLRLIE